MDFLNYVNDVFRNVLMMHPAYVPPDPGVWKLVFTHDGVYGYVKGKGLMPYQKDDYKMDPSEWAPMTAKMFEVYMLDESVNERGLKLEDFYEGVKICTFDDIVKWSTTQDLVIAF
jgi:sulfur relay (sulfurtransferase) complex TusBCD TusD component (DsrE family)